MSKTEDIALVSQVVLFKSERAFERLVNKYQERIRRFFLNLTSGNVALSDDLAQETFIKVYLNIQTFQGIAGFSTWLYRIAYNVFYDFTRSTKHAAEASLDEVDYYMQSPSSNADHKMDVYQSLKILNPDERTCILLFFMEDLSIDRIASITGFPEGTIKSHLSRGKNKLGKYLKHEGYE